MDTDVRVYRIKFVVSFSRFSCIVQESIDENRKTIDTGSAGVKAIDENRKTIDTGSAGVKAFRQCPGHTFYTDGTSNFRASEHQQKSSFYAMKVNQMA